MEPTLEVVLSRLDPDALRLVPYQLAKKYRILPLQCVGSVLILAMENPQDISAIDDIRFRTGRTIKPVAWTEWVKEQNELPKLQ